MPVLRLKQTPSTIITEIDVPESTKVMTGADLKKALTAKIGVDPTLYNLTIVISGKIIKDEENVLEINKCYEGVFYYVLAKKKSTNSNITATSAPVTPIVQSQEVTVASPVTPIVPVQQVSTSNVTPAIPTVPVQQILTSNTTPTLPVVQPTRAPAKIPVTPITSVGKTLTPKEVAGRVVVSAVSYAILNPEIISLLFSIDPDIRATNIDNKDFIDEFRKEVEIKIGAPISVPPGMEMATSLPMFADATTTSTAPTVRAQIGRTPNNSSATRTMSSRLGGMESRVRSSMAGYDLPYYMATPFGGELQSSDETEEEESPDAEYDEQGELSLAGTETPAPLRFSMSETSLGEPMSPLGRVTATGEIGSTMLATPVDTPTVPTTESSDNSTVISADVATVDASSTAQPVVATTVSSATTSPATATTAPVMPSLDPELVAWRNSVGRAVLPLLDKFTPAQQKDLMHVHSFTGRSLGEIMVYYESTGYSLDATVSSLLGL